MDPHGSYAGTCAGRLFPMLRFSYKAACDTRADNSNLLGGQGGGDVDKVVVMLMMVVVMVLVVMVVVVV